MSHSENLNLQLWRLIRSITEYAAIVACTFSFVKLVSGRFWDYSNLMSFLVSFHSPNVNLLIDWFFGKLTVQRMACCTSCLYFCFHKYSIWSVFLTTWLVVLRDELYCPPETKDELYWLLFWNKHQQTTDIVLASSTNDGVLQFPSFHQSIVIW